VILEMRGRKPSKLGKAAPPACSPFVSTRSRFAYPQRCFRKYQN
jgi:hypothetical protein